MVGCDAYRTSRGISLEKQYCIQRNPGNSMFLAGYLPIPSNENPLNGSSTIVIVHKMSCFEHMQVTSIVLLLGTCSLKERTLKGPRVHGVAFFLCLMCVGPARSLLCELSRFDDFHGDPG